MTTALGDFVFDEERHQLLRHGVPVHLTPKAYELLRLLLERRPAAVSKAEIHDRIWPATFVSDVNLATLVFEIRTALADDPNAPRYIRTVRGFGYGLCDGVACQPQVEASAVSPTHCRLICAAREVALHEGENILGRTPEAAFWIDHGSVSRRHARLTLHDGQATLEDLGSRHGTFVDELPIRQATPLRDGSRLRLGSVSMLFRVFRLADTEGGEGPVAGED